MDIFSLDGEVHFLSWLYTISVLSIQNINWNDVLFLLSFQFLFIVLAVVYCYHPVLLEYSLPNYCHVCVCGGGVCARARVCVCVICAYMSVYMGSSSVLVLIGSHSLCNSFVVNQFLFFTPNGENSLCYTPKKQWEQYGGKKMFCLFFISKIYSHVTQKWWPKTGMAIPYCLCWKLLHTRRKYSDISNLFAKLQHAKAPES